MLVIHLFLFYNGIKLKDGNKIFISIVWPLQICYTIIIKNKLIIVWKKALPCKDQEDCNGYRTGSPASPYHYFSILFLDKIF